MVNVYADANDNRVTAAFGQDSGDLPRTGRSIVRGTVDHHVVGPLEFGRNAVPTDRIADREPSNERNPAPSGRGPGVVGTEHDGEQQGLPRGRYPRTPKSTTPGGLLVGDHYGPFGDSGTS